MSAPLDDAALAQVEDLAHDLGKYIRFDARMEPPDAPLSARWQARYRDLYETRRDQDGVEHAFSIYARLAPSAPSPASAAPEAAVLAGLMRRLEAIAPTLRAPPPDGPAAEALLTEIDALTTAVAAACRGWRSWARAAAGGALG